MSLCEKSTRVISSLTGWHLSGGVSQVEDAVPHLLLVVLIV